MLEADLESVLLAENGADNRAFLSTDSVASDVVRYGEERERVQEDIEAIGGLVHGEQRVRNRSCHCIEYDLAQIRSG